MDVTFTHDGYFCDHSTPNIHRCQGGSYTDPMSKRFGQWLDQTLKQRGITHQAVADAIGTARSTVSLWTAGNRVPDTRHLIPLAKFLRIDYLFLTSLLDETPPVPGQRRVVPLPLYRSGRATPNDWGGASMDGTVYWEPQFPVSDLTQYFALNVTGTCLEPVIFDGDRVIVHRNGMVVAGCYVVVSMDGQTLVKRYEEGGGGPYLATNTDEIVVPLGEAEIIGVVIETQPAPRRLYPPSRRP